MISEAAKGEERQHHPGRSFEVRVILAALAFACLIAGGIEPFYFRAFGLDRQQMRQHLTELPYRKLPGYRQFLIDVHGSTVSGDSVGLWLGRPWNEGYEYGYQRSAYLLPSRVLLPLIDHRDRFIPANLDRILYLACWQCDPPFPGFTVVKRFRHGTLSRRQ